MNIKDLGIKYRNLSMPVKASFWFLICSFLQRGISVITTPIFTRLLTPSEYGQYGVFTAWYSILAVFISLNLYSGVYTQGLIKFDGEAKQYSSALQGLCLTLVLAWTVVYLIFHEFWNMLFSLTTIQMLALLLMTWTTAVFSFWSVEQRVVYRYRALVAVTLFVSVAKPLVGILFVTHAHDKVTARILGLAIVELIAYSGFFLLQEFRGKRFYSRKFWKYALLFNLPLVPHYLSQTVLSSVDRIMIQKLIGAGAAGIYSLAYSLSLIMSVLNTALMQTIEPWLYQRIKNKDINRIATVAYPTFLLVAVANLFLIALAPEIVSAFAPKQYLSAIWIIPPVSMSVYFTFAYTFFAVFEFYFEKTQYITLATTIGAVINIIANYLFIPRFGFIAAGYTTLACYMIFSAFHFIFMKKLCQQNFGKMQPFNYKVLFGLTASFMLAGFILLVSYRSNVLRFGIIAIALLCLYLKRHSLVLSAQKLMEIRKTK